MLLIFVKNPWVKGAHQQRRYWPPAAEIIVVPQLTTAPLLLAASKYPNAANLGIKLETPHVSST
jgi:hypothetical protein